MRLRTFTLLLPLLFAVTSSLAQRRPTANEPVNDLNTPLHLLVPDYGFPYGIPDPAGIKADLDRIYRFLDETTPYGVVDSRTGDIIDDYASMGPEAMLLRGAFRLGSYEWGVTYSGMLSVADATGDKRYSDYSLDRFRFIAEVSEHFRRLMDDYGSVDQQIRQILTPHALDDAGAMAAAMIKVQRESPDAGLTDLIENYINYIMYHEYRLSDGTFARKHPHYNTLWLDDLYMSVPALAQMGALTREQKYFNEAIKQIKQFTERMFVPEKGLYMHGWVESMEDHPAFFWGRANGWAILTMTEVLDVLPASHPSRPWLLDQYKAYIRGIAKLQSGQGFWHQLLDCNDSYLETSATAIFTYCIAWGINNGWLDPVAYGPVAMLGWNAVSTKINPSGQVEDVCVGTGMGFDPAFYYHRPVNVYAAHGYGPALMAGAEMIKLLSNLYPRMNDNAVQFYREQQQTAWPIFDVNPPGSPMWQAAGSTRLSADSPVIFLIGDSTVKNGSGRGENKQWGWGSFFDRYFDTDRITVENHALGGRSSRTFISEGLWAKVLSGLKPGDYLLIQFGHNDGGPLNTGRARASLPGIGEESQTVIMERHGGPETVYTFGHYLRMYIRQAKAKGAIPVVLSPTPQNRWSDGKIQSMSETYSKWAREVAGQEGVPFVDLNAIAGAKFNAMGEAATQEIYADAAHPYYEGSVIHGNSVIEGLLEIEGLPLNDYIIVREVSPDYDKPNEKISLSIDHDN